MKTIYLVRHGQTHNNVARMTGTAGDPLSEKGERQASLLAVRLKGVDFQAIVSSTYARARQTAEAIGAATGKPVEFSDLFVELKNPSEVEGKPSDDPQIAAIRQQRWAKWGTTDWRYSDEETYTDLFKRAAAALAYLKGRPEESLVVATHGAFMKALVELILLGDLLTPELSSSFSLATMMDNTGISVIELDDEGKWRLVRWNDTVHLEPDAEGAGIAW